MPSLPFETHDPRHRDYNPTSIYITIINITLATNDGEVQEPTTAWSHINFILKMLKTFWKVVMVLVGLGNILFLLAFCEMLQALLLKLDREGCVGMRS
jgi:hypothetical protein